MLGEGPSARARWSQVRWGILCGGIKFHVAELGVSTCRGAGGKSSAAGMGVQITLGIQYSTGRSPVCGWDAVDVQRWRFKLDRGGSPHAPVTGLWRKPHGKRPRLSFKDRGLGGDSRAPPGGPDPAVAPTMLT